jgi:hypothetical protein
VAAERASAHAPWPPPEFAERTPPAGWEPMEEATDGGEGARGEDLRALTDLLQALLRVLPPDRREQLVDLVRQLLVLLRAVLDLAIELLERRGHLAGPRASVPAQDIPIQ